jgi:energy-coupling factor transporter transmembrane protein EcfT
MFNLNKVFLFLILVITIFIKEFNWVISMIDILLVIIFCVLVFFLVFSVIKRIFGLLFKIAFFLLIVMVIFGGIVYLDLYRNNLVGESALIFVDNGSMFGYELKNGSLGQSLADDFLETLNYTEIKETEEANLGNYSLLIFIEGNFEETFIEKFSGRYKRYIDIFKIFNNDDVYFYPKTFTLSIIEKIRG